MVPPRQGRPLVRPPQALSDSARRWVPAGTVRGAGEDLARALGLHPLVADVLLARGYGVTAAARRFLEPSLRDLARPEAQADLERGAARLAAAVEEGEPVAVLGDYDVDGLSATALVVDLLKRLGCPVVTWHVPDRLVDGYGVSERGVRAAHADGAGLLVTVDCGANDPEQVRLAADLGMDVVICDHHPVAEELPAAHACLDPQRPDCGFADRVPCAAGVAFNLACGLRRTLRDRGWFGAARRQPNLKAWLDLVALATVADRVPLVGHNRILVSHGLEVIARGGRPGLAALCRAAGAEPPLRADDLAFRLGPRLNAAGRLGDAGRGVRLLLTRDPREAEALAAELHAENARRQKLEAEVFEQAVAEVEATDHARRPALVLGREGWHPGVVGIVAARLVERYVRPAVVVGLRDGLGQGSARTVDGFDVGEAVRACAEHLVGGGGHAGAAGVTVRASDLDAFRDAFCGQAEAARAAAPFERRLEVDAEVGLEEVDARLVDDLSRLEPFGEGNPEPVHAARGVFASDVRILKNAHLACRLSSDNAPGARAIGFWMAERAPRDGQRVDAAFSAGWNEFRGKRSLQLRLQDLRTEEQR